MTYVTVLNYRIESIAVSMKKKIPLLIVILVLVNSFLFLIYKDKHNKQEAYNLEENCKFSEGSKQIECWENTINNLIDKKGVDFTLQTVAQLANKDDAFNRNCHGFVHELGGTSYKYFKQKISFKITPSVTICSYGFYHGFMETAVQLSSGYNDIHLFCDYINKQLSNYGLDLSSECFHGIGHGAVGVHNPKYIGNAKALTDEAMQVCDKISQTQEQSKQCATGVFNGIANFYTAGEYGLKIKKDDPIWICKKQPERFKNECYALMARVYLPVSNNNLPDAIEIAIKTSEDYYLESVISNIVTIFVGNRSSEEIENSLRVCKSLNRRLANSCIIGVVNGYMQFGKPDNEYSKAVEFCQSSMLIHEEKNICYKEVFTYIKRLYPSDKIDKICKKIEAKYQTLCLNPN